MSRRILTLTLVLFAALLHGCAIRTPPYAPSVDNIDLARHSGARPVALGSFVVGAGLDSGTRIGLRGASMESSVGSDYAAYLAQALRQELHLAGKLDPKSTIEISGTLVGNDIAAAGISTNSGYVEARFVVRSAGQVRYDAVKRAEASWDSSLMGAIAIPKAQQQYPALVQMLLKALWSDPRFVAALQ
ncbi:MAG: hypothetical protein KF871_18350 [Hydrogenophaga sp.]|nr:hypothetical protein [Hydrogenophaga sp.]